MEQLNQKVSSAMLALQSELMGHTIISEAEPVWGRVAGWA